MIVSAWNNGKFHSSGAGYGLRITKDDRQNYFEKKWDHIVIFMDKDGFKVNISDSFWRNCTELRNKQIGKFVIKNGFGRWNKGIPPKLELLYIKKNEFSLTIQTHDRT